jgi:EKC/KEOPS complex subunit CGI121/TPRKB
VQPTSRSILAIKVTTPTSPSSLEASSIQAHLAQHIQGRQADPTDEEINTVTDWARVRKVYKLPAPQGKKGTVVKDEEQERRELEIQVLGVMALRGAN